MLTQVRLVNGSDETLIRPNPVIGLSDYDWGYPDVRSVSNDRTDTDGEDDTTQFVGASAISMTLTLWTGTRAILDDLGKYCTPDQRPYLYVLDDEWATERRVRLRADKMSRPVSRRTGAKREVQLSWAAPDGLWEDANESSTWITATVPATSGLQTPVIGANGNTYAALMNNSNSTGAVSVLNAGNVRSSYRVQLYGPCTAPALWNDSTGQVIAFKSGLVLGAGEYLDIDPVNRTVLLNSDPSASKLSQVDYTVTNWWTLQRGINYVRYQPVSATVGSAAYMTTRSKWIV
jgi:hypothetical protein